MKIKICGITNLEDARAAVEAGADALGFILYPPSPRYVEPASIAAILAELPPFVTGVGVFVDEPVERVRAVLDEASLALAQLHGDETPADCAKLGGRAIKSFRVRPESDAGADGGACLLAALRPYQSAARAWLLDTYHPQLYGGTGRTFDWTVARAAAALKPVLLSGGLTPENVADAVRTVRPYGVDVSTGVERAPGRKDHARLRAFIERAREADLSPRPPPL